MKEIERKFLVDTSKWQRPSGGGLECRQGYIFVEDDRLLRVRLMGGKGFLTFKARNSGISKYEFEYEIAAEDATEMLEKFCKGSIIEKVRYKLEHAGMLWDVDEFKGDNEGLITAEIELEEVDQDFEMPGWVGKEVSSDKRYLNVSLSKQPYKDFEKE